MRPVESAFLCSENIKSRCKYRTYIVTFMLFNYNYSNTLWLDVFGFHWFKRRTLTRVVTNLLYNYLRFWYLVLTNEPYIHRNGLFDPLKNWLLILLFALMFEDILSSYAVSIGSNLILFTFLYIYQVIPSQSLILFLSKKAVLNSEKWQYYFPIPQTFCEKAPTVQFLLAPL